MQLINATPHTITIVSRNGVEQDSKKQFIAETVEVLFQLEPAGLLHRVTMTNTPVGDINGIPIETVVYGEIEGLPTYQEGVFYIVSGLTVQEAIKAGRNDCLAPGALVRDKNNPAVILGCLFLQKP